MRRRRDDIFAQHPKAAEVPAARDNERPDYRQFKDVSFQGDEVTYVSLGDGTTSEGEFWEAMNAAALNKLPVIFCVRITATRSRCRWKCRRRAAAFRGWCRDSRIFISKKSTAQIL